MSDDTIDTRATRTADGSRSYYVNGQHAFDHDPHHTAIVRASFVRSTLNDLEA